jgi:hypothetical protein
VWGNPWRFESSREHHLKGNGMVVGENRRSGIKISLSLPLSFFGFLLGGMRRGSGW